MHSFRMAMSTWVTPVDWLSHHSLTDAISHSLELSTSSLAGHLLDQLVQARQRQSRLVLSVSVTSIFVTANSLSLFTFIGFG